MNITMLALGSRGDVLPYLALGRGLQDAGHRVRFCTFESFAQAVVAQGLDFHPIRGDPQFTLNASGGQALAESGQNPLRMARSIARSFGRMAESFGQDFSSLTLQSTDLIVSQLPGGLYGFDLAEKLGVPLIAAAVMPLEPTRHYPMLAFPSLFSPLPGYNAFTHRLAYQLVWQIYRPAIDRWRRQTLSLSKAPFWGYARAMDERRVPVINGFSAYVVPRPPDWGDRVHLTGYWFPEHAEWQPPDELCAFIESGPPPVFISFGSMPLRDPKGTTDTVLKAVQQSGQRALLGAGWGAIGRQELPPSVHAIDYAPYGWLFPRMGAVVHHGGSGTTASGLRAGVPAVVVPFLFDQFYWGRRLHALGVGPAPLPFKQLSVERLAAAITTAISDAPMRQRAAVLAEKIRAEDGVGRGVEIIEQHVRRTAAHR